MSLRCLPRVLTDLAVAAMGVIALAQGVAVAGLVHPVAVVFTAGWVGALLVRHRWGWSPALVPLLVTGHGLALQTWPNDSGITMLALFVSAGLFGMGVPTPRMLLASALWPAAVGALMLVTDYGEWGFSDFFYPAMFCMVLLGAGMVLGRATRRRREVRGLAEQAQRDLEEHRTGIVAAERSRIAQDLRALVAEQILGIKRCARRARELLEHGEATEAEAGLLRIEDAGRDTLADLRHMLGLLRRDMTEEALGPQPGLAALDAVVEHAAARGVAVTVTVEGRPTPLPRGVQVVVYRVVERSVEQACRAGVDRVGVRIRHDVGAVQVQVHAHGLGALLGADHLAIRERVVLYGGDLVVGTDEHDRDVLQVRLPLPAAAEGAPA
ncbi:MAG: histidine kinase dimerization/phosphoacceptor domain-containing protein [Egibacteraceae bacterium]